MTGFHNTDIDKGINLKLATTVGHREIPIRDHQWGSPVIEASILGSQTELMGV